MGTRADFYIGRGESAEWLGSIAWDGGDIDEDVLTAKRADSFRRRVAAFLASRDDATLPDASRPNNNWPWPWEDSNTTDYSWAFDKGSVYGTCFGHRWFNVKRRPTDDNCEKPKEAVFPLMRKDKKAPLGAPVGSVGSGIMVIGA